MPKRLAFSRQVSLSDYTESQVNQLYTVNVLVPRLKAITLTKL